MWIYALPIFIGAFLLFQIQLILARYLLPWFGGASNVWNTSMLFFQCILVVGYCYAHLLTTRIRSFKWMVGIHIGIIGASIAVVVWQFLVWGVPVLPGGEMREATRGAPATSMLLILFFSVGAPFFVLSSTSTLIQVWFSRIWLGRSPYRLYALSNAGSLLALLSYPFFIEPIFGLRSQAELWSGCFLIYCLLYAFAAVFFLRNGKSVEESSPKECFPPSRLDRVMWIVLPALGSIILLATTNKITEGTAVIPVFWVLPLATYLLTYIIVFEGRAYRKKPLMWILLTALALALLAMVELLDASIFTGMQMLVIYLFLLFIGCMHCHGGLHRLKPNPEYLTSFYLSISIGGAIGGFIVSLLAPVLFSSIHEFLYGLLACAVFCFVANAVAGPTPSGLRKGFASRLGVLPVVVILILIVHDAQKAKQAIYKGRNFYGTFVVSEDPLTVTRDGVTDELNIRSLVHGTTVHGVQVQSPQYSKMLTTYFSERSGVGLVLTQHPGAKRPARAGEMFRVGVIGLGAGTLAAYGKPHHIFRFYELDDDITNLSTGADPYFKFLAESDAAKVQVVNGDARISMEREIREGKTRKYDVLVVDAFSGDHVPAHLLTLEAFELYQKVLKPGGVIAIHSSSRAFMLPPLIITQAKESNLKYIQYTTLGDKSNQLLLGSDWILLSKNAGLLKYFAELRRPVDLGPTHDLVRPWTDDNTNPLQLLKVAGGQPFLELFAP